MERMKEYLVKFRKIFQKIQRFFKKDINYKDITYDKVYKEFLEIQKLEKNKEI